MDSFAFAAVTHVRVALAVTKLKGHQDTATAWLHQLPEHRDAESIRPDILDLLTMIVMYRSQYEEDASWLTAPRVHPDIAEACELEVSLTIDKLGELVKPFLDPLPNPPKRLKRSDTSSTV